MDLAIAVPRKELGIRSEAREKEAERFLKLGADWLLTIDSDQSFPLEAWQYILPRLKEADIFVIDAPNKGYDDSNIKYHPDGTLAYFTISCCLISQRVFQSLSKPWFSSRFAFSERSIRDGKIIWEKNEKMYDDNINEDIYFARKCLEAGVQVSVVPNIKSKHIEL